MNRKILIIIIVVGFIIVYGIYKIYSMYDYYNDDYYKYLDDIDYVVSSKFEESKYSKGYYHYYNDNISCSFNIDSFSIYNYEDGNEYLKDNVRFTLNDKVSDLEEVDLNGYKWYYMAVESNKEIIYYYATIKDSKGYKLEYSIKDYLYGDSNNKDDFCYSEYDNILSSIRFK